MILNNTKELNNYDVGFLSQMLKKSLVAIWECLIQRKCLKLVLKIWNENVDMLAEKKMMPINSLK